MGEVDVQMSDEKRIENVKFGNEMRSNIRKSENIQTPTSGLKNNDQPSFFKPSSRCWDT